MAATHGLDFFYTQIGVVHGATGLVGKVALVSVLGLVWAGVRRPGQQLLAGLMALQFLAAAWTVFSYCTGPGVPKQAGGAGIGVAACSLVLGIVMVVAAARPEGEWSLRPAEGWRAAVGGAAVLWAIYYPEFTRGALRPILFSPTGALPQPTLLVAAAAALMSAPNVPRLAGWTVAGGAVVVGLLDATGGVRSSWVLVGLGAVVATDLVRSVIGAGGILEDDVPPVDEQRRTTARRQTQEKAEPTKRWKLK